MLLLKCAAVASLAALMPPAVYAEAHCPGNIASVPLRPANLHQVIVAVSVNHLGPYNFLFDTGTETSILDSSLTAVLHLNPQNSARITGVGFRAPASFAHLDLLEVGSHGVANQQVLVYDSQNPELDNLRVRGVLGEDFLGRFDMLIDNAHSLLCLDDSAAMRADVKGPHIALATQVGRSAHTYGAPIITVRLSDSARPVRLQIDSGSNVCFLYNTTEYMPLGFLRSSSVPGTSLNGSRRSFSTLPEQDVQIGLLELPRVTFYTFAGVQKASSPVEFDGLLSTGLFRRVFISHTDQFAVLDPW